ncbi:Piwi-like protein 1, variant 2 [Chamberlinius hualienensis]
MNPCQVPKFRSESLKSTKSTDTKDIERNSKLVANYFRINSTPNWSLYQYHVDFEPEIESTRLKRALVSTLKGELGTLIFDGMMMFCINRSEEDTFEKKVTRNFDGQEVKLTFKYVKTLPSTDSMLLQVMNIQMRKNFRHLSFQLLGRHYFDPKSAFAYPRHNLEVWPGYVTVMGRYDTEVLLNTEFIHKIVRMDTVIHLLNDIRNRNPRSYREESERILIGCIVLTRYNNKTYKIDSIDWDKSPESSFPKKDNTTQTFYEYYEIHWQQHIQNRTQPLLVSLPSKRDQNRGLVGPILLVPELCVLTGLSDETRKNRGVMTDLARETKPNPTSRVDKLIQFMRRIQGCRNVDEEMREWNVGFDNNLYEFDGKLLKKESVELGGGKKFNPERQGDWSGQLRGVNMFQCVHLTNWLLVYPSRNKQQADFMVDNLRNDCPNMGVQVRDPLRFAINGSSAEEFVSAIRRNFKPKMQLVCCVVPDDNKARYDAIKKLCCIELPVASQVVRLFTLNKAGRSACTKIGIQLNCKLGGAAWSIKLPMENCMVVGFDSYRDSSSKNRMAAAMCCSLNKSLTKYHSRVLIASSEEDMVDGLVANFAGSMNHYKKVNGQFPNRVIFYRSGGSEGQLITIRDTEVVRLVNTFTELGVKDPKFAFVVVTKKHNTRIFEKMRSNEYINPPPGTVVDGGITRPEWFDFYVVSQSVREGTVAPTHYNIIHDTSNLFPSHQQRLAYKLTHLYYNWPGTIRVPAPCLYAYKLAFLTSQSLHSTPNESLSDTLFYL